MAGKFSLWGMLGLDTTAFKSGLTGAKKDTQSFVNAAEGMSKDITKAFKDISTMGVGEMRRNLAELRSIKFAGKTTEEIALVNKQIGLLTDEMNDLKAVQKGLGTEFGTLAAKGLQAFAAIGEVGFGIATMFGASDEAAKKYQQTMVNMIGVMQGIGVIQDALETKLFTSIAVRIKDTAATVAQTAAQWALNASMLVIIGTIGAVVVVLGAVIYGVYKLTSGYNEQAGAVKRLRQETENLRNIHSAANRDYQQAYRLMQANGASEKELKQYQIASSKIRLNQIEEEHKKLVSLAYVSGTLSEEEAKRKKELESEYKEVTYDIQLYNVELKNIGKSTKAVTANVIEQKSAYEILNSKIIETEQKIKAVLATGGVVSPELLSQLNTYKNTLAAVNSQYERLTNQQTAPVKTGVQGRLDTPVVKSTGKKNLVEDLNSRHQAWLEYYQKIYDLQINASNIEKQINQENHDATVDALSATFGAAASIFKENTIAYKTFAIAQATIDTYKAANMALASAPPPFNFILMGATIAAGIANVSKIAGAFANGGIVGGSAFSGDTLTAKVNSGEMILNGKQQANLFAIANGAGVTNGEVTFRIKGTELVGVLNNQSRKISNTR